MTTTFYPLEKSANLYPAYRAAFQLAGHHLLLLVHEGQPCVVDNICPHAGYPMKDGLVIDGQLRCPMHGYLFALNDGACHAAYEGPCQGIRVYDVVEQDGQVGVYL
jgi:nitrite reductase/ring-hydroxylating ferredoxin subunit